LLKCSTFRRLSRIYYLPDII